MQSTCAGPTIERLQTRGTGSQAGKYLIFHLGREQFGIQVMKVREILGIQEITPVPQTPAHVKGVINLRGAVVPVVDLRLKCGLAEAELTDRSCIVVVQIPGDKATVSMGVIVDGVEEVLSLSENDIEITCDFGRGIRVPDVLGLAKLKERVTILLDIDQILGNSQLRNLQKALQ